MNIADVEAKYPEKYNSLLENLKKYSHIPYKRYSLETELMLMCREPTPNNELNDYSYVFTTYDGVEEHSNIEFNVYVKNPKTQEMIWFGRFTNTTFIFNTPNKEVEANNNLNYYFHDWYAKLAKSGIYEVIEELPNSTTPLIVLEKGAIGYIDKITGLPIYYDQYIN